jgi:hypothetical protein
MAPLYVIMPARTTSMPSLTYQLITQAIIMRREVLCTYGGFARELCPIVLGHTEGRERVLAFQFAGGSKNGLPQGGQWKCLDVAEMSKVKLRGGRWFLGSV